MTKRSPLYGRRRGSTAFRFTGWGRAVKAGRGTRDMVENSELVYFTGTGCRWCKLPDWEVSSNPAGNKKVPNQRKQ